MKRYITANIVDPSEESMYSKVAMAMNPNTRPDTLAQLAKDSEVLVRYWVFKNPNTPEDIKAQLDFTGFDAWDWCLALDFYAVNFDAVTQEQLDHIKSQIKTIVEEHGYLYQDCEFQYEMVEDTPDADVTPYVSFNGLDDEDGEYTTTVGQAIFNLLGSYGWDVHTVEYV